MAFNKSLNHYELQWYICQMGVSSALQVHCKDEMGMYIKYLPYNWNKLIKKYMLLAWERQSNAVYCFFCLNYSQEDHLCLNINVLGDQSKEYSTIKIF